MWNGSAFKYTWKDHIGPYHLFFGGGMPFSTAALIWIPSPPLKHFTWTLSIPTRTHFWFFFKKWGKQGVGYHKVLHDLGLSYLWATCPLNAIQWQVIYLWAGPSAGTTLQLDKINNCWYTFILMEWSAWWDQEGFRSPDFQQAMQHWRIQEGFLLR